MATREETPKPSNADDPTKRPDDERDGRNLTTNAGNQKEEEVLTPAMRGLSVQEAESTDNPSGQQADEADHFVSDLKDAWGFGKSKVITNRPDAQMPVGRFSANYNMKHKRRGYAVIIAYSEYAPGGPGRRDCAEHDIDICTTAFKKLQYDVKLYKNLKKDDLFKLIKIVKDGDHSDCDSLVVVFMSHGGILEHSNQEFIWTFETTVNTNELWKHFTPENCPSLAGKPKMFFIQACRGEDVDKGVQLRRSRGLRVQTDAATIRPDVEDYAIPLNADMLMMWASYPGMYAFKSKNHGMSGSVFLHFLSKVLREDAHRDDLASMLLRITREVAVHYESFCPGDFALDKNKQIPYTVSTLMRKVHFFPIKD